MNRGGVGLAFPDVAQRGQRLGFVREAVQALPLAIEHGVLNRQIVGAFRLEEQNRHDRAANLEFVETAGRDQHAPTFLPAVAFALQQAERFINAQAERRRPQPMFGDIRQATDEKTAVLPNVQLVQGLAFLVGERGRIAKGASRIEVTIPAEIQPGAVVRS